MRQKTVRFHEAHPGFEFIADQDMHVRGFNLSDQGVRATDLDPAVWSEHVNLSINGFPIALKASTIADMCGQSDFCNQIPKGTRIYYTIDKSHVDVDAHYLNMTVSTETIELLPLIPMRTSDFLKSPPLEHDPILCLGLTIQTLSKVRCFKLIDPTFDAMGFFITIAGSPILPHSITGENLIKLKLTNNGSPGQVINAGQIITIGVTAGLGSRELTGRILAVEVEVL